MRPPYDVRMGIWKRFVRLVRSLFHREESMEQLATRMDETYREQTRLLQQVRRGVADVATSRKRVEVQLAALRQTEAQLDDEARQAVSRGDDAAARSALGRKVELEKAETDLAERHASLKAQEDKLQVSAQQVESGVERFRMRRDTLTARHAAASARSEINSATTGITAASGELGQAMAAAERDARQLEATADAVDEMVAGGVVGRVGEDPHELELRRFEAQEAEIESRLAELSSAPGSSTPDSSAPPSSREAPDGPDQIQK